MRISPEHFIPPNSAKRPCCEFDSLLLSPCENHRISGKNKKRPVEKTISTGQREDSSSLLKMHHPCCLLDDLFSVALHSTWDIRIHGAHCGRSCRRADCHADSEHCHTHAITSFFFEVSMRSCALIIPLSALPLFACFLFLRDSPRSPPAPLPAQAPNSGSSRAEVLQALRRPLRWSAFRLRSKACP